jgi:hypothetical protein
MHHISLCLFIIERIAENARGNLCRSVRILPKLTEYNQKLINALKILNGFLQYFPETACFSQNGSVQ